MRTESERLQTLATISARYNWAAMRLPTLFLLLFLPLAIAQNVPSQRQPSDVAQRGWKQMPLQADSRIGFRSWHQLVYDSVQRKVLAWMAVSGCDDPWSNALWAYDTASNMFTRETWDGAGAVENGDCKKPVFLANPPNHPGDRHPYHHMTYDTLRGRLWIYGGVADHEKCDGSGPGNCDNLDTWFFDSRKRTWTCTDSGGGCNAETSKQLSPGHRTEGAMAYDAAHDVIIFFGSLSVGNPTNDTWEYSPSTNVWRRVAQGGPPPRNADSLVYDSADHKIVLFGGRGRSRGKPAVFNDLWLYDTAQSKWTDPHPLDPPPGAPFPALAYDDHRNLIVYYHGPGSLWAYSVPKNRWFNLDVAGGPVIEAASGTSMTYDSSSDTFVLLKAEHHEVWQLKLGSQVPGRGE